MSCLSGGETTSRPNIDTFGRYIRTIFRELSLRAESDPGGANFYIFEPSFGLPKTTVRVGFSSSTEEKIAVRRDGGRLLIVYSIYNLKYCAKTTAVLVYTDYVCTHMRGMFFYIDSYYRERAQH